MEGLGRLERWKAQLRLVQGSNQATRRSNLGLFLVRLSCDAHACHGCDSVSAYFKGETKQSWIVRRRLHRLLGTTISAQIERDEGQENNTIAVWAGRGVERMASTALLQQPWASVSRGRCQDRRQPLLMLALR